MLEEVQERDWQYLLETLISKIEDANLRVNITNTELKIIKQKLKKTTRFICESTTPPTGQWLKISKNIFYRST